MSPDTVAPSTLFHDGELRAQELAGGGPRGAAIREFMPDQHRAFFAALPFVLLGATDADGWPVATMLAGAPGFIASPDPHALHLDLDPQAADPVVAGLARHGQVGLLGIDLGTRRRNRANGTVTAIDRRRLEIAVTQSFGNCPRYIQMREIHEAPPACMPATHFTALDARSRDLIALADTCFVATASGAGPAGSAAGVDISHRGGRPGFVRIEGNTLTVPDFNGNRYFNTLGNLVREPRAAMLFVDFSSGDLLQLQGTTEIVWDAAALGEFAGAERFWRFQVVRGWYRPGAVALRWSGGALSPATEHTGVWS